MVVPLCCSSGRGVAYCWQEETQSDEESEAAGIPLWLPAPVPLCLRLCPSQVPAICYGAAFLDGLLPEEE